MKNACIMKRKWKIVDRQTLMNGTLRSTENVFLAL